MIAIVIYIRMRIICEISYKIGIFCIREIVSFIVIVVTILCIICFVVVVSVIIASIIIIPFFIAVYGM